MDKALFLNGVFSEVLEEIIKAQSNQIGLMCTLQPYSGRVIKLLEGNNFHENPSIPFYLSTTADLKQVVYVAEIVGWENKRQLVNNREKLEKLNKQIGENQPIQKEVYFYSDEEKTKECVNLIEVLNLRKLDIPLHVGNLVKVSDGTPYKPRTQPGGWSPVYVVSAELLEADATFLHETLEIEVKEQVRNSLSDSSEARKSRLQKANKKPKPIQIISKGYKRNPDVIAEILHRANGICERCNSPAPFIRKKDNTPYLEVHHKLVLAEGGDDTVENSEALCPNCHREAHFGK